MGSAARAVVLMAAALALSSCGQSADPLSGRAAPVEGLSVGVSIVENPAFSIVATATTAEVIARSEPDDAAPMVVNLGHPRPTGSALVFQVIGEEPGWVEVRLPIRPNGSRGWVRLDDVALSKNPYRLEIDVSAHQLLLWHANELVLDTVVAIGTGATPTPIGDFYLTELLQPPDPTGPYGTYAYGLSGYSETLQSFNGGDGVIGLHGTNDPASLGSDVSHGCVRLANEVIDELATFLPLGTPVAITA